MNHRIINFLTQHKYSVEIDTYGQDWFEIFMNEKKVPNVPRYG